MLHLVSQKLQTNGVVGVNREKLNKPAPYGELSWLGYGKYLFVSKLVELSQDFRQGICLTLFEEQGVFFKKGLCFSRVSQFLEVFLKPSVPLFQKVGGDRGNQQFRH